MRVFVINFSASEPHSTDSNPSGIEEEWGLPQPPLDIGAFTPQFPMELSFSQVCIFLFPSSLDNVGISGLD